MPNQQKQSRRRKRVQPLHRAPNVVAFAQPNSRVQHARIPGIAFLSSSLGGDLFASVPIDPTGGLEWSSFASIYSEFRIVGGLVTLANAGAGTNSLALCAFDPGQSYTPTSIDDLLSYSNRAEFQVLSQDRAPFRYGFTFPRAGGNTSIDWHETAVAFTPSACFLLASTGLSASNRYFLVLYDFYVEFRNRS